MSITPSSSTTPITVPAQRRVPGPDVEPNLPAAAAASSSSIESVRTYKVFEQQVEIYQRWVLQRLKLEAAPTDPTHRKYLKYHCLMSQRPFAKFLDGVDLPEREQLKAMTAAFHSNESLIRVCIRHAPDVSKGASITALADWLHTFRSVTLDHVVNIAVYQHIASQGEEAAKEITHGGWFDRVRKASVEEIMSLMLTITEQGPTASKRLWRSRDRWSNGAVLQKAPLSQRLELSNRIAEHCGLKALKRELEPTGLLGDVAAIEDVQERFTEIQRLIPLSHWLGYALVTELHNLHIVQLPIAKRLAIYELIVSQGEETALRFLTHGSSVSFCGGCVDDAFSLYHLIAKQGERALAYLEMRANDLGFKTALQSCTHKDQRVAFCKTLAKEASWTAIALLEAWQEVPVEDLCYEELLEIYRDILRHNAASAERLARHLLLNKDGPLSPTDRLSLYYSMSKGNPKAARRLSGSLENLELELYPVEERLNLALHIAAQDCYAIWDILQQSYTLGLDKVALQECLQFFRRLIRSGEPKLWNPFLLTDLGLEELAAPEAFRLCCELIERSCSYAQLLADNLKRFAFHNLPSYQRFAICCRLIDKSRSVAHGFLNNNEKTIETFAVTERLTLFYRYLKRDDIEPRMVFRTLDKIGLQGLGLQARRRAVDAILEKCPRPTILQLIALARALGIAAVGAERSIALCEAAIQQDAADGSTLLQNISSLNLLGADYRKRLALWKKAQTVSYLRFDAGPRFLKFGFAEDVRNCETVNARLALFKELIAVGKCHSIALIEVFNDLGLDNVSLDQRIELGQLAKEHGFGQFELLYCFRKLGFEKDVLASNDLEQRLNVCERLVAEIPWAGKQIVDIVFTWSFRGERTFSLLMTLVEKDRLAAERVMAKLTSFALTAEQCLTLCHAVIDRGDRAVIALIHSIDQVHQHPIQPAALHDLYQKILHRDFRASLELCAKFHTLKLGSLTTSLRHQLMGKFLGSLLIQHTGCMAALARSVTKASHEDLNPEECLAFYHALTGLGEPVVNNLADAMNYESLAHCTASQRVDLYTRMARKSPFAAGRILKDLSELLNPSDARRSLLELFNDGISVPRSQLSYFERHAHTLGLGPVWQLYKLDEHVTLTTSSLRHLAGGDGPIFDLLRQVAEKYEGDSPVRLHLTQWLSYCSAILRELPPTHVEAIHRSGILSHILGYRSPSRRFALVRELSFLDLEDLQSLNPKGAPWTLMAKVLVARLRPLGFNPDWAKEMIAHIAAHRPFRSSTDFDDLAALLFYLLEQRPYSADQLPNVEKVTLDVFDTRGVRRKDRPKTVRRNLQALLSVGTLFGEKALFDELKSVGGADALFAEKFQALFPVGDMDHFAERYAQTLGRFRDTNALLTYLGRVQLMPKDDQEKAMDALTLYVKSVLEGTFHDVRYDRKRSPHLEHLFEAVEGLEAAWRHSAKEKRVIAQKSTTELNYKAIFTQAIVEDKHLEPMENYPFLQNYFEGHSLVLPTASEQADPNVRFQALLIQLCERAIDSASFLNQLPDIDLGELQVNINALKNRSSFSDYLTSEDASACDHLLLGTEIQGSCQRVNGTPTTNRGLLGYLLNGEIRPIIVKHKDRLVARALMRLLWDDTSKCPVILLERIYSNVHDEAVKKAIIDWAIAKAATMGLTLVSPSLGSGEPYEHPLSFKGGCSPYVYSDAACGVREGAFTISNIPILYSPHNTYTDS